MKRFGLILARPGPAKPGPVALRVQFGRTEKETLGSSPVPFLGELIAIVDERGRFRAGPLLDLL